MTKAKIDKLIKDRLIIGWQEWCSLPDLQLPAMKAKIDTGAKTSSLHAFNIELFQSHNEMCARFDIHPIQNNNEVTIRCTAKVIDQRYVMSSNGHKERRYVISTGLRLGDQCWDIELTLSNRDPMIFRMLLGREALNDKAVILPGRKTCLKKYNKSSLSLMYQNHKHLRK